MSILFPEFIFVHAVEELKMALDDLFSMEKKEEILKKSGWVVTTNSWFRFLHGILNIGKRSSYYEVSLLSPSNQSPVRRTREESEGVLENQSKNSAEAEQKVESESFKWTLTHSYFANMGGLLEVHSNSRCTAYQIANSKDPDVVLKELELSEKEIKDKAKADVLVKTIAVLQIGWLVLSVITRKAQDIPTCQLEIVTLAFAILAIFAYCGNSYKPKDIGIPVNLHGLKDHSFISEIPSGYSSFSETIMLARGRFETIMLARGQLEPTRRMRYNARGTGVPNDNFRQTDLTFLTVLLAVSALIFGGLHLLAWDSTFATNTEKWIWRAAGIGTASIPMSTLVIHGLVAIHKARIRKATYQNSSFLKFLDGIPLTWLDSLEKELLVQIDKEDLLYGERVQEVINNIKYAQRAAKLLAEEDIYGVLKSIENLSEMLEAREDMRYGQIWGKIEARIDDLQISTWKRPPEGQFFRYLKEGAAVVEVMRRGLDAKQLHVTAWYFVTVIVSAIVYAVARLSIITIAFTSFRFAPAGIYISTWARFLPNIS